MPVTPARPEDAAAIRALFRATVGLGRALPFADRAPALLDAYERLCLDPYLAPDSPAVVGALRETPDAPLGGYALVCLDDAALGPWRRGGLARFAAAAGPVLISGKDRDASAFVRDRLADAWALRRPARAVRGLPHAHLNAAAGTGGLPGRVLADFVDAVCRAAGEPAWYGEMNARVGRRAAAITARWGGEIVERTRNRTLSRLAGTPVERLTVRRRVPWAAVPAERPAA